MRQMNLVSVDNVINHLEMSDLGFLMLQKSDLDMNPELSDTVSGTQNPVDVLLQGSAKTIDCLVFPVCYQTQTIESSVNDITAVRSQAVWKLFDRWTMKGYNKHHAKSPYGCKQFTQWLDQQDYMKADYLIMDNAFC